MDRRFSAARRAVALAMAAGVWLALGPARADVVSGPSLPEDDDCPDGSQGASCSEYGHGGSDHCAPRTCVTDGECGDGEFCEDARLCITYMECYSYELDGGTSSEPSVEGNCDESGSCDVGTCESRRVCTARTVFDDVGCDCAVALPGGGGPGTAAGLALIAAALVLAIAPIKRRLFDR
jgi:hypothetical protein